MGFTHLSTSISDPSPIPQKFSFGISEVSSFSRHWKSNSVSLGERRPDGARRLKPRGINVETTVENNGS